MKIAVSAEGTELSSNVAPFREQDIGFIVYDPDHSRFSVLNNTPGGTRLLCRDDGCVEMIADAGIDVLVVREIALEAAHRLHRSGVRIYECISATAWEAIQALKLNVLRAMDTDTDVSGGWNVLED